MRILYIIHEATISGAPMQMLRIIRNLKEQHNEWKQDILMVYGGNALQEQFRQVADDFFVLHSYSQSLRSKIRHFFAHRKPLKAQYDVIVANTVVALAPGIELKKKLHAPLVFCLRESEYSFRIYDNFEHDLSFCDKIITVSNLVKTTLVEKYNINPALVEVIHNFPTFKLDPPSPNTQLPYVTSGRCIIGLSGEVCWRKGCDILPLLATAYQKKYPEDQVLFVWIGLYSKEARHQMEYDADLSGTKNILFMNGITENPIEFYHSFDIFLTLSREESFANVVAEAAMLAKPVVGFDDCVGAVELLKQGNACLTAPYLDIDGLSDILHDLYADPDKRHALGLKAKEWFSSQLNDNRSTEQYYKILTKIASKAQ